jgi:hypothetical protein
MLIDELLQDSETDGAMKEGEKGKTRVPNVGSSKGRKFAKCIVTIPRMQRLKIENEKAAVILSVQAREK